MLAVAITAMAVLFIYRPSLRERRATKQPIGSHVTKSGNMKAIPLILALGAGFLSAADLPQWRELFNGKDLSGWVNVNTDKDTWKVKDGMLICSGHPIGVMRTDKQYENFILHIEWKHIEPGGNSGVFAWSDANPGEKNRLPNGIEVQMLELDWVNLHKTSNGETPPVAYVHGELFGVGGVEVDAGQSARPAKQVN